MACHVDAHHATAAAVRIMRKYGIYERRLGLVGVRVCGAFVDFVWFGVEWNVYCNLFVVTACAQRSTDSSRPG